MKRVGLALPNKAYMRVKEPFGNAKPTAITTDERTKIISIKD